MPLQHVVPIHLHERCHLRTQKHSAAPLHNVRKHAPRHLTLPRELSDYCTGQLSVTQQLPGFQLYGVDSRESVRDKQPTAVGDATHDRGAMRQIRGRSEKEEE